MKRKLFGALAFALLLTSAFSFGLSSCKDKDKDDDKGQACKSKADCPVGYICQNELCQEMKGCDPADENACGDGQFCSDLGECLSCGQSAKSCKILGINGQIGDSAITAVAGSKVPLAAVAMDANGMPIYCAEFTFAGGTISGNEYTVAASDSKVTATVTGSNNVTCEIAVNVMESAGEGTINVFVYDDATGKGISGAAVVLDTNSDDVVLTNDKGIATVNAAFTSSNNTFAISAFKEDYNYVTFADVPQDVKNVAIPMGSHPLHSAFAGGSKGSLSFDEYAKNFLKNAAHLDFRVAYVTNTIPLSSILSFDFDNFVGHLASNCSEGKDGCYSLSAMGLGSLLDGIKDAPSTLPLPGGVIASGKNSDMKASFNAPAIPGKRIPWALGIELAMTDAVGIAPMFMGSSVNVQNIFSAILPLFSKFGTAVGMPMDMPVAEAGNFASQDVSVSEKFRVYRELKVESLPKDNYKNINMDALGIVRMSNAQGFGAMLTGVTVSADIDGNGKIDAATVCKIGECPAGVSGAVAEGNIGVLYAPAQKSIQNADDRTIIVSAPVGKDVMSGNGLPSAKDYGPIRLTANIIKGAPENGSSIKASDFIGFPTISDATLVEESRADKVRGYAFNNAEGADMNILVYAGITDSNNSKSNRWIVYSKGSAIRLPDVPNNLPDPINASITNDVTAPLVIHLSLKLDSGKSFADLAANNGNNMERALEQMNKLSIFVPFYAGAGETPENN